MTDWDLDLVRFVADHRWGPLTVVFAIASAWWVKSVLLVGIGLVADLRRPPRVPFAAVTALAAYGATSGLVNVIKVVVDRPRPPVRDPSIPFEGTLPESMSFPSGHAGTAFAAATVIALVHPRLRWWVLGIATVVAASRLYLGVHHLTDVVAGAVLGALVGAAAVWVARRARAAYRTRRPSRRAAST